MTTEERYDVLAVSKATGLVEIDLWRLEIHSGPDREGRYCYTTSYDTDFPPYCSRCGGCVESLIGLVYCIGYPYGSTPERRRGCGLQGPTMMRGQVFNAPLPTWHTEYREADNPKRAAGLATAISLPLPF